MSQQPGPSTGAKRKEKKACGKSRKTKSAAEILRHEMIENFADGVQVLKQCDEMAAQIVNNFIDHLNSLNEISAKERNDVERELHIMMITKEMENRRIMYNLTMEKIHMEHQQDKYMWSREKDALLQRIADTRKQLKDLQDNYKAMQDAENATENNNNCDRKVVLATNSVMKIHEENFNLDKKNLALEDLCRKLQIERVAYIKQLKNMNVNPISPFGFERLAISSPQNDATKENESKKKNKKKKSTDVHA